MNKKEIEAHIINKYQADEKMMILVYAQWCVNHDLDPIALYEKAYPNQLKNPVLLETLELTVSKQESEEIADQTVLNILHLFGNDDLAFVVQEEIQQRKKK
ncbi:hypothetical protein D8M04_16110 [Oceanobacillus piezotolerans]|uniref:Uncharacterized protein n=1 Tax=Oceanobacillus piezotolerans TaxID=2448030 RepID=A0A498D7S8_9BACI|nr:hypothetical protein [Oceanobacillus piezotolerans]RLL42104.1 hypothetical protein D8M04_16110 [Oceanobacillus piezotolerans]